MTLSSFLLRPSQTATFTTTVTGSVVTASPAILTGVNAAMSFGDNASVICDTYSGATLINRQWASAAGGSYSGSFVLSSGIDCPSGISVTITTSGAPANPRVNIYYILK